MAKVSSAVAISRNSLCKEFHSLRIEYTKRLYSYASCARPG